MIDAPDAVLLEQFARNDSEEAFTEIVRRHVGLVHSVAFRQTQNAQHAEEITQAVFIILARKASSLGRKTILAGWLYHTSRLTTANFQRAEVRRVHREQKAFMQPTAHDEQVDSAWQDMGPLLEEAMSKLKTTDRDAIVLRFFENKSFQEVGTAMGLQERAAQKRVARGLEKLRAFFTKRGVVLSATVIAGAVSANSVQAAPVGLVKTIATSAITKGSILSAPIATLINGTLKTMKWTTIKLSAGLGVTALILAAAAVKVSLNDNRRDAKAMEILKQVRQRYAALSSYDSAGQAIDNLSDGRVLTATFTMRLGRSNRYHFEYEQNGLAFTNKGAAWSSGDADYFANDMVGQTTKLLPERLGHNLGDLWDLTGGAPLIIPALFFGTPIPDDTSPAGKLNLALDPSRETVVTRPDEQINGIDCHVILLKTDDESELLWIGKNDGLIHQSQEAIKSKVDEMTDAEADQMLAGFPGNLNLTKTTVKQRVTQARKEAAKTGKTVTVYFPENKGKNGIQSATVEPPPIFVFTQTHSNIALNQPFSPQDFARLK